MKSNFFSLTTVELGIPELRSNVYIFEYANKVNLIDTWYWDLSWLITSIKNNYPTLDNIFITHGHFDHIDGLMKLLEVFPKVTCHINKEEARFLDDSSLSLSRHFRLFENYRKNFSTFRWGDIVDWVKTISTPWHTIWGTCYLVEEYNVCFTWDTLFSDNHGRTDLPTGDYDSMRSSIGKLLTLDPQTLIYPWHWPYGIKLTEVRDSDSEMLKHIFEV